MFTNVIKKTHSMILSGGGGGGRGGRGGGGGGGRGGGRGGDELEHESMIHVHINTNLNHYMIRRDSLLCFVNPSLNNLNIAMLKHVL